MNLKGVALKVDEPKFVALKFVAVPSPANEKCVGLLGLLKKAAPEPEPGNPNPLLEKSPKLAGFCNQQIKTMNNNQQIEKKKRCSTFP